MPYSRHSDRFWQFSFRHENITSSVTQQTHNSSKSVNNWGFNKACLSISSAQPFCLLKQGSYAFFPSDYHTRTIPDPTRGLVFFSPRSRLCNPVQHGLSSRPPGTSGAVCLCDLRANKRCRVPGRAPAGRHRGSWAVPLLPPSVRPSSVATEESGRGQGKFLREGWTRQAAGVLPRAGQHRPGPARPVTSLPTLTASERNAQHSR